MAIRILSILVVTTFTAAAGDLDGVRSLLRSFNDHLQRPEPQSLRMLFTEEVDYRDGARRLQGAEALISLFTKRQIWSERTPPLLEEESVRFVGPSAAFVDAQLVQYGSTIVKSGVSVVLLLSKDGDAWKISAWRTAACMLVPSPD